MISVPRTHVRWLDWFDLVAAGIRGASYALLSPVLAVGSARHAFSRRGRLKLWNKVRRETWTATGPVREHRSLCLILKAESADASWFDEFSRFSLLCRKFSRR
jgi:hypothetical protein